MLRRLTQLAWRERSGRSLVTIGVAFFLVACTFSYYGQLNRKPSADTDGTIYTAVAIVQTHTIWLDRYLPIFQDHVGQHPYMLVTGPGGHLVNVEPSASSILALPMVGAFDAIGVKAKDWNTWQEAGMLTAALTAAASVAVVFALLTRLTTRPRAVLIAATYAWGTLEWGISGQALWNHGGATLALAVALLALVDRRLTLAGAAITAMIAFRFSTPVIALFLLPLVGRQLRDWARFVLGIAPFALALLAYNWVAFGSPFHQGFGNAHVTDTLHLKAHRVLDGAPALLFSPGRGLFVYSPILLFAIVGAVRAWRTPLYRWCAVASLAYVVVVGNSQQWWGGECFGPRKLTDMLPLLAVLLVPAVEAIVRTRWLGLYLVMLALSVFIEVLGASAQPRSAWFDKNPNTFATSTWWHPLNNELLTLLQTNGLGLRLLEMTGILALALALGLFTTAVVSELGPASWRQSRQPA